MNFDVGDVFVWKSYPKQSDGKIKNRWFICFGKVSIDPLETDGKIILILAHTTTSRIEYYREGESRHSHPHIRFSPEDGFGFSHECLIDLSYDPEVQPKSFWDSLYNSGGIEFKGRLSNEKLKQIFCALCSPGICGAYSPMYKKLIRVNMVRLGIQALPEIRSHSAR